MNRPARPRIILPVVLSMLAIGLCACSDEVGQGPDTERALPSAASTPLFETRLDLVERARPERLATRRAFFGDLHVHTRYSFDAYTFGTLAAPADAYRYARGEVLKHPSGFDMQLRAPLDFYAVTDHAMFMGVAAAAGDPSTKLSRYEAARPYNDLNEPENMGLLSLLGRLQNFSTILPNLARSIREGIIPRETVLEVTRAAWLDTIDAARRFDDPGHFTTFVAYEYTSSADDRGNLHRNVIFRGAERLPDVPFSRFHSRDPEDLWTWMDGLREVGIESLAIPHNSNGSNGQMFKLVDWAGDPLDDDYTRRRIRNEPLAEITQVKGTSETHPALSTRDEWADFEIMPYRIASMELSTPEGSYLREALLRGLALEAKGLTNPWAFGFVGASDTHTGATSDDESDFHSKLGLLDAEPEMRGSVPLGAIEALGLRLAAPRLYTEVEGEAYVMSATPTYGASGLTGVWAEENTRESIYEAFRRKETFATSGPRIRLRFFAGQALEASMLDDHEGIARAYAAGVPMGGDLEPSAGETPGFLVWALADPQSAPLQRIQIVKGWIDAAGEPREEVYDVACSDGGRVDASTHRCPENGASVDLSDCSISEGVGAGELRTLWRDPDFDVHHRAFYYARVLENPTCRWSTWDALRAGTAPRPDLHATIQERAWSSPIHLHPARRSAGS